MNSLLQNPDKLKKLGKTTRPFRYSQSLPSASFHKLLILIHHRADGFLNYTQITSCEMPHWMKHKLESRLPGEISITSDTQMTPKYCISDSLLIMRAAPFLLSDSCPVVDKIV